MLKTAFFVADCFDGDVRLFNLSYTYDNGQQTVQAHVLVCLNGSYLPVCDLGWDDRDAQVVCNQEYGDNYSKGQNQYVHFRVSY